MAQYDGSIRINTSMDSRGFNRGVQGVTRSLKKIGAAMVLAFSVDAMVKFGKEASRLATSLEVGMLRVNDIFKDSNVLIKEFVDSSAKGLGLSERAAYEYASIYGNLFSSIAADTEENARLTIDMLRASAVVASKTGRTMEDVMSRIRSGILGNTEAIEDLGIEVRVAMLEMTDIFKQVAGDRSWEKLSFKEQQQIRILGILEQANTKFGDTVLNSSALIRQKFGASLENLKVTIGNLLNVAIIPMLEKLTELNFLLNNILIKVFGKYAKAQVDISSGASKAAKNQSKLADSIDKAGKKANKALAGFDELDVLQSKMLEGGDISKDISLSTSEVVDTVGQKEGAEETASAFDIVLEKVKELNLYLIKKLYPSVILVNKTFGNLAQGIEVAFRDIGENVLKIIKKTFSKEGVDVFFSFVNSAIKILTTLLDSAITIFNLIWSTAAKPALELLTKIVIDSLDIILDFWNKHGSSITTLVVESIKLLTDLFINFYQTFLQPFIQTSLELITYLWDNHVKGLIDNLLNFSVFATNVFLTLLNDYIIPFIGYLVDIFGPAFEKSLQVAIDMLGTFLAAAIDIQSKLIDNFELLIKFLVAIFNKDWETAWDITKQILSNTIEIMKSIFSTLIYVFKVGAGYLAGTFTAIWEATWNKLKEYTLAIFESIKNVFKSVINSIVDGLNFMISKLNGLKFDVPDWVPGIGGNKIGFDVPKIPKLAKGAVIQPNSPFMAMLGDQPSGINIETPLETMLDAFKQALSEMNQGGAGEEVVLQIDGDEIGRVILPSIKSAEKQRGVNLVMGV